MKFSYKKKDPLDMVLLREVVFLPQQPTHDRSFFDKFRGLEPYKQVKVEKFILYHVEDGEYHNFCVKDKDTALAYLVTYSPSKLNDKETLIIEGSWVPPKFRGEGLMPALYRTLHTQGFRLISDVGLSPEGLKVWKKLLDYGAKVLDLTDYVIHDAAADDFSEPNEHTRFILERAEPQEWQNHDNYYLEEKRHYISPSLYQLLGYRYD